VIEPQWTWAFTYARSNHLLHVIGVGFQLYSQLKKNPHDGIGVLGSSVVSTVSQTTRLGKGSSVTTRDERVLESLLQ